MRIGVGVTNLILGIVYTSYAGMTLIEMKRAWKTMGFSHFGAAWIAMAGTCGAHHLEHGLHTLFLGRPGGPLDLVSVLVGFPAGVTWFLLRIEAFTGGRGDREISGTPRWLAALPTVAGVYVTALVAASVVVIGRHPRFAYGMVAQFLLLVLYCITAYFLFRTQFENRRTHEGWSLSGVSLGIVFPTCGLMHAVYAVYAASGRYNFDLHLSIVDWLAVPAAVYFLWVVRGLYRDALQDWNRMAPQRPVVLAG